MQDMEAGKFVTQKYRIASPRLKSSLVFLMLGDLHGEIYGDDNESLVRAAGQTAPDVILCPGDMVTAGCPEEIGTAADLLRRLSRIAPVYLAPGNHETKLRTLPADYRACLRAFRDAGVRVLRNESASLEVRGEKIRITGLELPASKYGKFRFHGLGREELLGLTGPRDEEAYQVLIAHNPAFVPRYLRCFRADLTVCGHYHGGMIRITKNQCLMSPYGFPLPRYGYGHFREGDAHAVVTSGLGDHRIPFRLNNPTEIVKIVVTAEKGEGAGRGHAEQRSAAGAAYGRKAGWH